MFFWIIATLCSFFIKGLCGFANTLIFTTILSFGNSNVNISPVELLLGYPTNIIMVWKGRKSIQWNVCLPLILFVIMGSIPGVFLLKNADNHQIKILFGIVIILLGLEMLFHTSPTTNLHSSKAALTIIGILSGILCGLYGVGALLSAYVSRVTADSRSFKANICMVFWAESTFRLILYGFWGIITLDILKQVISLLPLMFLGLVLGMFSGRFLNEILIKKVVIIMLILSGIALILSNL